MTRYVALLVLAVISAPPAIAAADGFTPGVWELTRTMRGGPMGAKTETETVCFSPETLRADPAAPVKLPPPAEGGRQAPACAFGPVSMSGGKLAYTAMCHGPMGKIRGDWSGTYAPDRFAATGRMKMSIMSMTASFTGRYTGPCGKR